MEVIALTLLIAFVQYKIDVAKYKNRWLFLIVWYVADIIAYIVFYNTSMQLPVRDLFGAVGFTVLVWIVFEKFNDMNGGGGKFIPTQ